MAKLIPFTKLEAVVLLDAYLGINATGITRQEAVKNASSALRKMAVNSGIEIDDIYRNTNGITFQMASMESAYLGHTILKPATHLFTEVVLMYKTERDEYNRLLKEAKSMIEGKKTTEDLFWSWLSQRLSPTQVSEMRLCYPEIEGFCLRIKALSKPLFETTEYSKVKKLHSAITENRLFQLAHKKQMKKYDAAIRFYIEFVKNNEQALNAPIESPKPVEIETVKAINQPVNYSRTEDDKALETMYPILFKRVFSALKETTEATGKGMNPSDVLKTINSYFRQSDVDAILKHASWSEEKPDGLFVYTDAIAIHTEVKKEPTITSSVQSESDIGIIDFCNIPSLAYTTPIEVKYFDKCIEITQSWTDAYVNLFNALYEDYESVIPVGKSFYGSGRVDLSDFLDSLGVMTAPKRVAGNLMLETNISATDTARKIKALLDICNVDYENVIIRYQKKVGVAERTVKPRVETKPSVAKPQYVSDDSFYEYLQNTLHMAPPTCRSYVSAIRTAERYASENGYSSSHIYNASSSDVKALVDQLLSDNEFKRYNESQHNRFQAAFNKLLDMLNAGGVQTRIVNQPLVEDMEPFETVLAERFVKGFRLGSTLDMKKFKRYYEELLGKTLDKPDNEIEQVIRKCGIIHEEKLFLPRCMLDEETKQRLFSYIHAAFDEGKSAIYYEALFHEFSEVFLDHYIYDASMLKSYLEFENDGSYFTDKNHLAREAGVAKEPIDEIRTCMRENARPMTKDELYAILTHLPKSKIDAILSTNLEFPRNSKGEFFHADLLALTDEELENIAELIDDAIRTHHYISGTELMNAVRKKYPQTYEGYSSYSDLGWREALKYKYGSRFSFKGNIISNPNEMLSMIDVFGDLAENSEHITTDELQQFADEMGTVIYFDAIYDKALRINEKEFVSKHQAAFRIKETDTTLDRFCTGNYLPLGKIREFGIFPDAGFRWTTYLLESYVAYYSDKYVLIHPGYNRYCAVGAIVKKSAGYENLDELVIDVLADSGIQLNKAAALDYLVNEGYIARRTYAGIEGILLQAAARRKQERRP